MYGGVGHGVFLIVFGIASIALGLYMRNEKIKSINEALSTNKRDNERMNLSLNNFNASIERQIGDYLFLISEDKGKLAIKYRGAQKTEPPVVVDIENLSGFEIIQDNMIVSSGGLGGALAGGFLAGGVGAIVGASVAGKKDKSETIGIKFLTKDINIPIIRVNVYDRLDQYRQKDLKERHSAKDTLNKLEDFIAVLDLIKQQE